MAELFQTEYMLRQYSYLSDLDRNRIANPNWEHHGRRRDWRNYVPVALMAAWDGLTMDVRMSIYLMARHHMREMEG